MSYDFSDPEYNYVLAAVNTSDPALLEAAAKAGCDLDRPVGDGDTSLHHAFFLAINTMIQAGLERPPDDALKVVGLLIRYGADTELRNDEGHRPVDVINLIAHTRYNYDLLLDCFRGEVPDIDNMITFVPRT